LLPCADNPYTAPRRHTPPKREFQRNAQSPRRCSHRLGPQWTSTRFRPPSSTRAPRQGRRRTRSLWPCPYPAERKSSRRLKGQKFRPRTTDSEEQVWCLLREPARRQGKAEAQVISWFAVLYLLRTAMGSAVP